MGTLIAEGAPLRGPQLLKGGATRTRRMNRLSSWYQSVRAASTSPGSARAPGMAVTPPEYAVRPASLGDRACQIEGRWSMYLVSFRVERFRNILDSGEIQVDPAVTCLVGKNESGKTNLLHALSFETGHCRIGCGCWGQRRSLLVPSQPATLSRPYSGPTE